MALGLLLAIAIAIAIGGGTAWAQSPPAPTPAPEPKPAISEADKAASKLHFDLAEGHKARGDAAAAEEDTVAAERAYREAAEEYQLAFRYFPHPAFLYNLAQMQRRAGETEAAIDAYERYLKLDPNGARADEARGYLAELQAEQQAQAKPLAVTEGAVTSTEVIVAPPPPTIALERAPPQGGGGLRIGGLATAAVGGALLAVGIKYGLDARSANDEINGRREGWLPDDPQRYADGESAESRMILFTSLGAATVAAGGVLYWLGHRRRVNVERTALVPLLLPDRAAIAVRGRF